MWLFFGEEDEVLPAATVDLDFKAIMPTGFALSRPDPALGRSPTDGRWTSYPANSPRFDIDPISLESRGVLIEPSRTQLLFKSRTPTYTVVQGASVADAAVQTPFGLGALKLTPNTALTQHGFDMGLGTTRAAAIPDGATVAFRVVLKGVGYSRLTFFLRGRDAVYQTCSINLAGAGAVVSHTISAARVSLDTDGFHNVEMVWNVGSGVSTPSLNMSFLLADGTRTHAADGTSHALIAYVGAEIGTECTTPILSDGTTSVVRSADTFMGNVSWIGAGPSGFAVQYIPHTSGELTILHASGSLGNSVELQQNAAGLLSHIVYANGAGVCVSNAQAPSAHQVHTALVTAAGDDFRVYMDGVRLGVDSEGAIPLDLALLHFGATATGAIRGPMTLGRLKYWSGTLSDFAGREFSRNISLQGADPDLPRIDLQTSRTVLPSENAITITMVVDGPMLGSHVSYRTVDETTTAGVDYAPVSGSIFIEQSQVSAAITILLGDRSLVEDRTFRLELYGEKNAILLNRSCAITLERVIPQGSPATTQYDLDYHLTEVPTDWVHSRNSVASARNLAGTWITVAANTPRFHFHAPGVVGLLIEGTGGEQRLFDSVDPQITTVAGTKNLVTTDPVPMGTRHLQWRKTAVVTDHKLGATFSTSNCDMPTGEFTLWFTARWINWIYWKLRVKGIDNVWREAVFNLSSPGTVVSVDSGAVAYIKADEYGGGWMNFGLYRTQGATAGVAAEFELIPVSDTGVPDANGDTGQGIDICHVQMEPAAGISTPLMVQGATAKTVRVADVFKVNTALSWYKDNDFSLGVKFTRLRDQPAGQRIFQLRDSSNIPAIDDYGLQTVNGGLNFPITVASTARTAGNSSQPTVAGVPTTALIAVSSGNSAALFHDGAKEYQIAIPEATLPVGVIRFGATEPSGLNPASILIHNIYHWSYSLTDADAFLFSANLQYVPVGGSAKPLVSVPASLTVAEGGVVEIPVTKIGATACQVSFTTKAQTAKFGADYNGIGPVTVSFTAGETVKVLQVQTLADAVVDGGEAFAYILSLLDDSCALGNASGTCTILEPAKVQVPATLYGREGQTLDVTITKTGFGACSVNYRTQQQTATLSTDYTGLGPLTATFAENETAKVIQIPILADAVNDPGEYFNFLLETPVGCSMGTATCRVTILQAGEEQPAAGVLYQTPVTFAGTSSTGVANDFGYGYDPYYVTSLGDNETTPAAGTLRHALQQSNRVIVFEVGGVIKVPQAGIRCSGHNLVVAGETAPSPGIIVQGGEFIATNAENVLIRHITIERGYDTRELDNSNGDAVMIVGSTGVTTKNVWFDHCATFWSNDEAIQLWKNNGAGTIESISFTNCIFSEPLYNPQTLTNPATGKPYKGHYEQGTAEPNHNYGMLIGYGTRRIDVQHCLFTDVYWRAPWIDGDSSVVVANCLGLNSRFGAHLSCNGNGLKAPALITVAGYLMISGANVPGTLGGFKFHGGNGDNVGGQPTSYPLNTKVWVKGLYGMRGAKETYPTPKTVIVGRKDTTTLTATEAAFVQDNTTDSTRPIDLPTPVTILTQDEILDRAKLNVGPRPKERAQPHVRRQITKLTNKDGAWVNHESEVGGFSGSATTPLANTSRSLRGQNLANPPKFLDGTTIPAFPTATDKAAVRAWLRKFLDELQYD